MEIEGSRRQLGLDQLIRPDAMFEIVNGAITPRWRNLRSPVMVNGLFKP